MLLRRRPTGAALTIALLALALTGCAATDPGEPGSRSPTFQRGVLAPEGDSGSSADRRAVRRAAAAALSDEHDAFVVSRTFRGIAPARVLAAETSPAALARRRALLARARSAPLADGLLKSVSFFLRQDFAGARTGERNRTAFLDQDVWADSAFHVDEWQGVQVSGDVARVLLRGEGRGTTWGGRRVRDAWAQYKLVLRRDVAAANGWRVVHQQAASTAA